MKKAHRILVTAVVSTMIGAIYLSNGELSSAAPDHAQDKAELKHAQAIGQTEARNNASTATLAHNNTSSTQMESWQTSPFASGEGKLGNEASTSSKPASPEAEVVSAEELARRKKMQDLGYMVPTDYYQKDLRTLRQMAKNGDAFAMVHLGEKYYFELNGRDQSPDFEKGVDYATEARRSFSQALAAGNIRSAAIISETYMQENKRIEAYAWHMLSEQLGDRISAEWFKRTQLYTSLTAQERKSAQEKIPGLIENLNKLSQEMKLKPLFQKQA